VRVLGLLVVIAAVVCGLVWFTRRDGQRRAGISPHGPEASGKGAAFERVASRARVGEVVPPPPDDTLHRTELPRAELREELAQWVRAELLTEEQSAAIAAYAQSQAGPAEIMPASSRLPRRIPVVGEALGYLGGMLAVIGLVLLVARYWSDTATAGRLALSGAGAAVLFAAGRLVHERADPALARLRWFLWLASTAALALLAGVLAVDGLDVERGRTVALVCGGAVALYSALLWRWRERPFQQLTCLGGVAVLIGATVAEFTGNGPVGLTVWLLGAVVFVLGARRVTPLAPLTEGVGGVVVIVGAFITVDDWRGFGLIFVVVTAGALLAFATTPALAPARSDERIGAILGASALLQSAPAAVSYFAQDAAMATGLVTWVIGAALTLLGTQRRLRAPVVTATVGAAAIIGGAALTGAQWTGFAPIFGIVTAIVLVGLGMLPGQVLLSVFGCVGLLINVPWAIGWFFPGDARAPLLILITGVLIIGVAVLLSRMGQRIRRELGPHRHGEAPSRDDTDFVSPAQH